MPGEGGEEHVEVGRLVEALMAFARDPEPQRPTGGLRVAVPSAPPMIETLTGPEAA
jgi:hypothetical protein